MGSIASGNVPQGITQEREHFVCQKRARTPRGEEFSCRCVEQDLPTKSPALEWAFSHCTGPTASWANDMPSRSFYFSWRTQSLYPAEEFATLKGRAKKTARCSCNAQNEEYEVNSLRAHCRAFVGSRPPGHRHPDADRNRGRLGRQIPRNGSGRLPRNVRFLSGAAGLCRGTPCASNGDLATYGA
jgi:hypothetical protein